MRAEALATPPPADLAETVAETVISADTPAVIPVHLPVAAFNAQGLQQAFPGLHVSAQAQVELQARLDEMANVTVGITTAAVNQGEDGGAEPAAKSRTVQKDAGEGDPPPPPPVFDLVGDLGIVIAAINATLNALIDPMTFDMNAFNSVDQGEPEFWSPNGIPDRAELLLVQEVLNTEAIDYSADGGVSHDVVVARWQSLMDMFVPGGVCMLGAPLGDAQMASFKRVIAGYCVLGDTTSVMSGVAMAVLSGWTLAEGHTLLELFPPMPWPLSAQGNFNGGDGLNNYAKFLIAAGSVYPDCVLGTQPWNNEPLGGVYSLYSAMLHGSPCDQECMLAQIQSTHSEFQFRSVTVKLAGHFLSPTVGRCDFLAGLPFQWCAEPDVPWRFDHWEVTETGPDNQPVVSRVYTRALTLDPLSNAVEVRAVAGEPSDPVSFADPRLEQAVRAAAMKLNGQLLWSDVGGIGMLEARGLGITSLDGLQCLSSLTYLDLRENEITDLTPMGSLYRMKSLLLGYNCLVQTSEPGPSHPLAPLAGMVDLEFLDLGWAVEALNDDILRADRGQSNHIRTVARMALT